MTAPRDLRLVAPAVVSWVAAGIMVAVPALAGIVAGLLWCLTGVACVLGWLLPTGSITRLASITLASCALIVTVIAVVAPTRYPRDALDLASGGRAATVTVTVTGEPSATSPSGGFPIRPEAGTRTTRYLFRGTVTQLSFGDQSFAAAAPALLIAETDGDVATVARDIRIGSQVTVRGTVRARAPEDRMPLMVLVRGAPRLTAHAPSCLVWAAELRAGFASAASTLPGDGGDLLPGLAIGDTRQVSERLDQNMKASSLSHLTAVSGANCAVVVAAMMLFGGLLGLRRRIRIGASIVVLAAFVVLVTPEGSVLRASVMAVVVLIALGSGRKPHPLPALALAVVILLVSDPWLARDYGFALSVLATAGLLTLASPLAAVLARRMPRWMALVIAIPLAAQLACQPVLVLLDPSLAAFGVPANMLAGPAAPVATMAGLVGCLMLPLVPGLGQAFLQIAWFPSQWVATVAHVTADLPLARLPWLAGFPGLVSVVALTAIALMLLMRRVEAPQTRLSLASLALLLVASGCYGGALLGTQIVRHTSLPGDWQIAACDIGQGDAVVLRSGGAHALIDTGPDAKLLTECLDRLGVRRIDLLVLTHYDWDHVGGTEAVLGMVDVALVGAPEHPGDTRMVVALEQAGARVVRASSGMAGSLGEVSWNVLWPPPGPGRFATGNPGSITLWFRGSGMSSLFLGDLGEDAQDALQAMHALAAVDVVKVAHHGSADQSARLYEQITARLGLISVGAKNSYGHPSDRVLRLLRGAGTMVLRTDARGMILISPPDGGGEIRVWSER